MLISARAMKSGLDLLKPLLIDADIKPRGKIALGTVQGDLHDIGKNLVGIMLEGAGFAIYDMGTDVSPGRVIEVIQTEQVDLVGLSALLTTTMPMMGTTIKALSEAGLREQVKVMVGGAPITKEYAQNIGADGYAPDASQATKLALELIGESTEWK
jgi:5-methyltetrahydrofolate--homocysteine methyltransferase